MKVTRLRRLAVAIALPFAARPGHATIDHAQAASVFAQAQEICMRDNGALWGHTLCGAMILVDTDDRAAIANQPDADGVLKREGDLYIGTLPKDVVVSDTTITWSGTRWCELMWPWPMREDDDMRHVVLAHENFHRIQVDDLGIPKDEGDNAHLDTLDGRYLIELEWRALTMALTAPNVAARRAAISDAILFRHERYRLFTAAHGNERALENNEGIAEYTGVRLGLVTQDARVKYALRDMTTIADAPSFVRSFAYATGPAYGLLLDSAAPDWHVSFKAAPRALRFDQRLAHALHLPPPQLSQLRAREAVYDKDGVLRLSEVKREQTQRAAVAAYRAKLVDGPVLRLQLTKPSFEFKPQSLVPLGDLGIVYPTFTLHDVWGNLTVTDGGVLMTKDFSLASLSVTGFDTSSGRGAGWTLELKPGWKLVAGPREGDYMLRSLP